jgi:hypothetical protein
MIPIITYSLIGAAMGWLLAAVEDGTLASFGNCLAAGLFGLPGLFLGCIHSAIASNARVNADGLSGDAQPNRCDRLLVRAIAILAVMTSPILIFWVNERLSSRNPDWIASLLLQVRSAVFVAFSVAFGAAFIWCVVRGVNFRADTRRAKPPTDALKKLFGG